MKKFILILILILLLTPTNLNAGQLVPVVGTHGEDGGVSDGVTSFTPQGANGNLKVRVQEVIHIYAIDITFSIDSLVFPDLIWNPNQLDYVFLEDYDPNDMFHSITVTNYSDMPIKASLIANEADGNDGISLSFDKTNATIAAVNTDGTASSGVEENFTLSITSDNWPNTISYYTVGAGSVTGLQNIKVGEITVSISK